MLSLEDNIVPRSPTATITWPLSATARRSSAVPEKRVLSGSNWSPLDRHIPKSIREVALSQSVRMLAAYAPLAGLYKLFRQKHEKSTVGRAWNRYPDCSRKGLGFGVPGKVLMGDPRRKSTSKKVPRSQFLFYSGLT